MVTENLRAYIREIEKKIENGYLEEAVAHSQYILKTFPMHIDTFRMLGKAYLEARNYSGAADNFQRVLNAVPDDFVSNVGLSIISDDDARLNESIWYMERAFEVQPSNSAIQSELKRLYGKRDGVEPSKIRLSRDALANMYSQGELFNQAITEILAILEQDPDRPDLHVMLMRVYYHSGKKVEAVESAKALLKKLPNCLDALRVLVDILPSLGHVENISTYRQQLALLDPYSAFTSDSAFTSNLVADSAVTLQRLDYLSAVNQTSPKPDEGMPPEIGEVAKSEDLPPVWMQTPETGNLVSSSIPIPSEIRSIPEETAMENATVQSQPIEEPDEGNLPPSGLPDIGEGLPENSNEKNALPDWLNPLNFAETNEQLEHEPASSNEPLAASIPEATEASISTGMIHEEHVENQDIGETLAATGNGVPEALQSTASAEIPSSEYIEPLKPVEDQPVDKDIVAENYESDAAKANQEPNLDFKKLIEHQPEEEEDFPSWLTPILSGETSIIRNIEPESGSIDMPAVVLEPEISSQEKKSVDETAFPDWLQALGAGSTGEIAVDSSISDTQPITTTKSAPEKNPFEKSESLESDSQKQIKSPELTPSDSGEKFHPSEQPESPDLEDKSMEVLESMPDKQVVSPEDLPRVPPEIFAGESTEEIRPVGQVDKNAISPVQEPIRSPEDISTLETPALSEAVSLTIPDQPIAEVSPASEEVLSTISSEDTIIGPEVQAINGEESTMAWLESLSADQETRQSESLESPVESSSLVQDRVEEIPDEQPATPELSEDIPPMPEAVNDIDINVETTSVLAGNEPFKIAEENQEPGPNWSYESENEQPADQAQEEVVPNPPDIVSDDENAVIPRMDNNLEMGVEQGNTTIESAGNEQPAEADDELPDWLKDLEPPSTPRESSRAEDDFSALLHYPAQGLKSEPPLDVEAPSWLNEKSPMVEQTIPTMPEEWVPVDEKLAASLESEAIHESPTSEDWSQIGESQVTDEIPAAIEQTPIVEPVAVEEIPPILEPTPVVEPARAVESPQVVEYAPVEEIPAALEQTPVVEPTQAVETPQVVEPVPVEETPAVLEQTPVGEPEQAVESPQVMESAPVEETPAVQEQPQVVESEPAVESPQVMESAPVEETPAVLEQSQVVEPEPAVESPQVVEPVPVEEIPVVLEQPQIVEPEPAVESPQVVEPVPVEKIPAVLEQPQVVESERAVEATQVVEPVPVEEIPAFLKQTQVAETEKTVEPPQITEPVAPEVIPAFLEQTRISETKVAIETPTSSEATNEDEPSTIPPAAPVQPPTIGQMGVLSPVPSEDRDADLLSNAQSVLDQKSVEEAMNSYSHLIRNGRLLPEVIHDLQEASSRFPMDMNVWQTLGDAYMRSNRLQDALDAYTKAEELLR